jgi:hypothetical protein
VWSIVPVCKESVKWRLWCYTVTGFPFCLHDAICTCNWALRWRFIRHHLRYIMHLSQLNQKEDEIRIHSIHDGRESQRAVCETVNLWVIEQFGTWRVWATNRLWDGEFVSHLTVRNLACVIHQSLVRRWICEPSDSSERGVCEVPIAWEMVNLWATKPFGTRFVWAIVPFWTQWMCVSHIIVRNAVNKCVACESVSKPFRIW